MKVFKLSFSNLFLHGERAFIILALFFATSPQTLFLENNSTSLTQGNLVTQAIWSIFYLCILFLIFLRLNSFIYVFSKQKLLLLLVFIALFSFLWSGVPTVTLRKSIALFFTTTIGVYIGMRYTTKDQLKLIAVTLSIAALLSLILIMVNPNLGIMKTRLHEWRGIYHQKGPFGRFMALGSIALLILIISGKRKMLIKIVMFAIMLFLMFKAMSVTAIVSFVVVAGTIFSLRYYWKRWRLNLIFSYTLLLFLVIAVSGLFAMAQADFLTGLVGKDVTLSGRIKLWNNLIDLSGEKLLVGYGYNGFWLGWNGPSASIWLTNLWEPTHAHNGFLDILLDIGIFGLSILLIHLFVSIIGSFRYLKVNTGNYASMWPLLYLLFILINSLTQSVFLTQNSILWIIYVAITTTLAVEFSRFKRQSNAHIPGIFQRNTFQVQ